MPRFFQCGRYRLALNRPLVMGILNITPDSFSDGGRYHGLEYALVHAEQMIADGVDIIDIGGESTRPGSPAVPLEEEMRRVLPVVYALRDCGKPLSVDTYKPELMREAIAAGADMINDIYGFRAEGALSVLQDNECGVCVMHMQKTPQTMQEEPFYQDVVAEVGDFLAERIAVMEAAGVARERLLIDPGFGFGKTVAHNLALLRNVGHLQDKLDVPLLAGLSRKTTIGVLTGKPVDQRMAGSVAAALFAAHQGAAIVRVHDVAETVDALKVWRAASDNEGYQA